MKLEIELSDVAADALDLMKEETGLEASAVINALLLGPWTMDMLLASLAEAPPSRR